MGWEITAHLGYSRLEGHLSWLEKILQPIAWFPREPGHNSPVPHGCLSRGSQGHPPQPSAFPKMQGPGCHKGLRKKVYCAAADRKLLPHPQERRTLVHRLQAAGSFVGVPEMQEVVPSPLGVDGIMMTRSCCKSQSYGPTPLAGEKPSLHTLPSTTCLCWEPLPQEPPTSASPLPRVLQLISGDSCCPFLPKPHPYILLGATRAMGEAAHLQGTVPLWKH